MAMIEVADLSYGYGRHDVLREVSLAVAEGSIHALLGPNGAGKTTLLQIVCGLRRPRVGRVALMGREVAQLTREERAMVGYVAEGQRLPGALTLDELESYLAPLYPSWDRSLAAELRRRFRLDGGRRIRTLSRGESMKAALLCALAPRPRVLLMDEPFTGMDLAVKDELVRGLLDAAGTEGWTVLLSSHDVGELELLADHVALLDRGRLVLSAPMETVRAWFRHVEVLVDDGAASPLDALPREWLGFERAGPRIRFLVMGGDASLDEYRVRQHFPAAARIEVREASLREIYLAATARESSLEVAPLREPVR